MRSEIEHDLVARYHAALLDYGVTDYDADTCWRDYRLGVIQAPLITGLGFAFAASTDRGDEMILTMLHRGCRAIRELKTLELLGSLDGTAVPTASANDDDVRRAHGPFTGPSS